MLKTVAKIGFCTKFVLHIYKIYDVDANSI